MHLHSTITDDFYVDDGENNDYDYPEKDVDNIEIKKSDIPSNINDFISKEISDDANRNEHESNNKYNSYNKNRPSLEYLEKQQRKQQVKQKKIKIDDNGGRGIFSDDDDDDDDKDNDHEFFLSQRKTNYFRKNTNDAIKIISTPHGKVGIVYDQTSTSIENSSESSSLDSTDDNIKKLNEQKKITPVLTSDGKVALLYRGASENTKYEPILNLTILDQQFTIKQQEQQINNYDNKTSAPPNNIKNINRKIDYDTTTEDLGYDDDDDDKILIKDIINPSLEIPLREMKKATIIQTTHLKPHLEIEYENSILPNINRPLSEVLGIKKNQFKQFRIKDTPTTAITTATWLPPLFKDNDNNDEIILGDRNRGSISSSSSINYNNNKNILTDINMMINNNNEYDDKNNNYDSNRPSDDAPNNDADFISSNNDYLSKSEVVNLAIIPHFDEEFELIQQQQQRYREQYAAAAGNGLHYHHRYRYHHFNQDLTSIHCIMQALMGLAAISTVFGMLGAFFKQRVIDQFRTMHW